MTLSQPPPSVFTQPHDADAIPQLPMAYTLYRARAAARRARLSGQRKWRLVAAVGLLAAGAAGCGPSLAGPMPLGLLDRGLVSADDREMLYRLRFTGAAHDTVLAYLRRPAGSTAEAAYAGIVLVAGRETGRRAAQVIPGPLDAVVLAVEYPAEIPVGLSLGAVLQRLPAIRRSAYRIPGILVGAARYLASDSQVDSTRIAIVGVSFGVPFAAAAGTDPIFRGVALHHGGADLALLFRENLPIRNSLVRRMVARMGAWYLRGLEPALHVDDIPSGSLLLINGLHDTLVPRASALRLAAAAQAPVRQIWLPHGHLMPEDLALMRELADSTLSHFAFLRASR